LTNDLYGIKRIVTPAGVVTYAAPFTADGHSDRAMAAALALRAAVEDVGLIKTKLGPKLRTAGLRRF
jgi:phage FluMu gp28-like protein